RHRRRNTWSVITSLHPKPGEHSSKTTSLNSVRSIFSRCIRSGLKFCSFLLCLLTTAVVFSTLTSRLTQRPRGPPSRSSKPFHSTAHQIPASGSRSDLRRRVSETGRGVGYQRSSQRPEVSMATRLHRANHRIDKDGNAWIMSSSSMKHRYVAHYVCISATTMNRGFTFTQFVL